MVCKQFQDWLAATGPIQAARLISEFEASRDRPGLTYQSIQTWVKTGTLPPSRVPAISAVSGIAKDVLDPETFGDHAA